MFIRYGLLALAVSQAATGVWALVAPKSFYSDFPPGRGGWVSTLGPYSEHLTIDYGALSLALVTVVAVAAVALERRLVLVAASAYLVWSVPHLVYHLVTLDRFGTTDAVGNAVTLGATVLLPAAVIVAARRARWPTTTVSADSVDG
jgi:hypothetical protein